MSEKLVNIILGLFGGAGAIGSAKEIIVFLISLMPILELRGGLIAAALLGLKPIPSYIISIVGNLIPVPFILLFINKILAWMRTCKIKLVLFVGIPLPGTGAWTGCLIASVLELDRKKSFIATVIGVFIASIIMMILSFGILKGIVN